MTWDPEAVGRAALLAHPRTQLVAAVNCERNFVHWARGVVDHAITISAPLETDEDIAQFEKFVADKKLPDRAAAAVYNELRRE